MSRTSRRGCTRRRRRTWSARSSANDLFANLSQQNHASLRASINVLRSALTDLQEILFRAVRGALREPSARESVVAFFGNALRHNAGRAKMQFEPLKHASHGFVVNLGSVLLKLCLPFLNPDDGKAFARITPAWIDGSGRVDWTELTKLTMTEGDDAASAAVLSPGAVAAAAAATLSPAPTDGRPGTAPPSAAGFHFICECFFLTGYAMHLGLVRALTEFVASSRDLGRRIQVLQDMDRARPLLEGTPMAATMDQRLGELRGMVEDGQRVRCQYEAGLLEDGMRRRAC